VHPLTTVDWTLLVLRYINMKISTLGLFHLCKMIRLTFNVHPKSTVHRRTLDVCWWMASQYQCFK